MSEEAFDHPAEPRPFGMRLLAFVGERFGVSESALVCAFAAASVLFASNSAGGAPSVSAVFVAAFTAWLFFAQMRIAEAYRDKRPATVTVGERRAFLLGAAAVQATITLALHPPLLALLYPAWFAVALVAVELLPPDRSQPMPALALTLRAALTPLVALYAVGADQLTRSGAFSPSTLAFVAFAALGSFALELARGAVVEREEAWPGMAARGARELGVKVAALEVAGLAASFLAFLGAGGSGWLFAATVVLAGASVAMAVSYGRGPTLGTARRMRGWAGLYLAIAYASVSILPAIERLVLGQVTAAG